MISGPTRMELWQHLLDVDRMCRYYEKVHAKATYAHWIIRISTLIFITGGIVALLDLFPWENIAAKSIFALTATVLTIMDAVLKL